MTHDKAMMSPDWKENYEALLAEVRQLTSHPSWDSNSARQHLENILDSFKAPGERDWCAMHIEGHCPTCGLNHCPGCKDSEKVMHTPWLLETHPPVFHSDKTQYSVTADGVIVAVCGTAEAEAKLIVRAVNNHEKLLAALETAYFMTHDNLPLSPRWVEDARALIEEAKKAAA